MTKNKITDRQLMMFADGELDNKELSMDIITKILEDSPEAEDFPDTVLNILGGLRSSCTYVGAPTLKQLSKCTTFVRVNQQHSNTFGQS